MSEITIRDLADKSTTAESYAELCRECGTDPIAEEGAILSALESVVRRTLPEAGTPDYWLFLADQTCTAQEEHNNKLASETLV